MIFPHWNNPEWEKVEKVHDWRNYISDKLKQMWPNLSEDVRQAIAENADDIASREEWD